jgi:hypothetical protein
VTAGSSIFTTPIDGPIMGRGAQEPRRTSRFLGNWRLLTQDPGVLDMVSGYKLDFLSIPKPWTASSCEPCLTLDQSQIIDTEVKSLLAKSAIRVMPVDSNQFVCRIFVVPKQPEGWRPVLNLKPLNKFLVYQHFKMENWYQIRNLIKPESYLARIDLKDAYLSVPMHADSFRYLCFDWQGIRYAWTSLPFGLSSAPRVFTKIMKPVIASLRSQGITLFIYLDDILIAHLKACRLAEQVKITVDLLESLGFLVNRDKSDLIPRQSTVFLGFTIDTVSFTLTLPQMKMLKLQRFLQAFSMKSHYSGRELASLTGKLSAAAQALLPAPLYFRNLQRIQAATLLHLKSYEKATPLSEELK